MGGGGVDSEDGVGGAGPSARFRFWLSIGCYRGRRAHHTSEWWWLLLQACAGQAVWNGPPLVENSAVQKSLSVNGSS